MATRAPAGGQAPPDDIVCRLHDQRAARFSFWTRSEGGDGLLRCAAMSSPVIDVRIVGGWDIRDRWFGVVVGATPRTGELPRGQTIPWRVIAAQIAPRERGGSR